MTIFNRKPSVHFLWHKVRPDQEARWSEADIQSYIVLKLRDWLQDEPGLFLFEGSLEGNKMTPRAAAKAKALGMESGVPDLRIYLSGGRLISIELKKWGGVVSPIQKARHAILKKLGFKVYIVKEKTPKAAWEAVLNILNKEGL